MNNYYFLVLSILTTDYYCFIVDTKTFQKKKKTNCYSINDKIFLKHMNNIVEQSVFIKIKNKCL